MPRHLVLSHLYLPSQTEQDILTRLGTAESDIAAIEGRLDEYETWVDFVPSFTGWSDWNGTVDARYARIGQTVIARYQLIVGSDTSPTDIVGLSLPVTAATDAYGGVIESHYGTVVWRDVGSGTVPGWALLNDANNFGFAYLSGSVPFAMLRWSNAQAPFTVVAGDEAHVELVYEAAA